MIALEAYCPWCQQTVPVQMHSVASENRMVPILLLHLRKASVQACGSIGEIAPDLVRMVTTKKSANG